MEELLLEIFKSGGVFALLAAVEAFCIVYLYRASAKKDAQLLELSERRLKDITENKEDFEELSKNLEKSFNLVIQILKKD